MDSPSLPAIVQGFLATGDRCIACLEAGLVQDWVKTSRIVILVEHTGEHGFLVCLTTKLRITSSADIIVEKAFPVNDDFKCEIDTTGIDVLAGADLYVKVTYQKKKLLFELPANSQTNFFMSEIGRAAELYLVRLQPPSKFEWLKQYVTENSPWEGDTPQGPVPVRPAGGFEDSFLDLTLSSYDPQLSEKSQHNDTGPNEPDSPDNFKDLPRQSIAQGATPLAARESVVRLQLAMREDDYTDLQYFKIFIGTWNVNGQSPTVSISDWLSADPKPPDLYAIGFQELDLSKEAFLFNDSPKEEEWLRAVELGLHPEAEYQKVKLIRLIGMMLVVFVQTKHSGCIANVAADTVGTGILGKMGNKGGVSVRLDLHNTSICFVNCHLAAHVDEYERRNQDYSDICNRTTFLYVKPARSIKDHDQIFWLGDMNYRIMDLDTETVKNVVAKQHYASLLEHDQLKLQHSQKRIFVGFTEGEINFRPTYKYDPGTDHWDSSEKSRPPAWCDRILWKGEHINQLVYRSHDSLLISDHKPVSSVFHIGVKVIDQIKYRRIYEEIMKKLDKLENEFLPQVSVDKLEVKFDDVRFIEVKTQNLTIANTGQVPVEFSFRKKHNCASYCKEWLKVNPCSAAIKPGEKCDVLLEVVVDKRTASKLNSGQDSIYDILVLHLERGKDIFITITGTYQPSCFGSSLEALVRIPFPVREISPEQLKKIESNPLQEGVLDVPFDVPKELWLLVDQLYKYGLTQDDLFQQSGLMSEIQMVRDALDTRLDSHLPGSIHSIAETLLLFLDSLAEPVIPYSFFQRCIDCSNNYVLCKQVITQIPTVHKSTFIYVMSFLKELLVHSANNKLDAKLLATIFGGVMLRSLEETNPDALNRGKNQALERKKATFVYHFLMNEYDD